VDVFLRVENLLSSFRTLMTQMIDRVMFPRVVYHCLFRILLDSYVMCMIFILHVGGCISLFIYSIFLLKYPRWLSVLKLCFLLSR
jgi:hypothetical protein